MHVPRHAALCCVVSCRAMCMVCCAVPCCAATCHAMPSCAVTAMASWHACRVCGPNGSHGHDFTFSPFPTPSQPTSRSPTNNLLHLHPFVEHTSNGHTLWQSSAYNLAFPPCTTALNPLTSIAPSSTASSSTANPKPIQYSNKRWCCGDQQHFDLSVWAFERLAETKVSSLPCSPFCHPCIAFSIKCRQQDCWLHHHDHHHHHNHAPPSASASSLSLLKGHFRTCSTSCKPHASATAQNRKLHFPLRCNVQWGVIPIEYRVVDCGTQPEQEATCGGEPFPGEFPPGGQGLGLLGLGFRF